MPWKIPFSWELQINLGKTKSNDFNFYFKIPTNDLSEFTCVTIVKSLFGAEIKFKKNEVNQIVTNKQIITQTHSSVFKVYFQMVSKQIEVVLSQVMSRFDQIDLKQINSVHMTNTDSH